MAASKLGRGREEGVGLGYSDDLVWVIAGARRSWAYRQTPLNQQRSG
jgi:hypothetical protein